MSKDKGVYALSHIITFGSGVVITLIFAKYLQLESYNNIFLMMAVINFLTPVATFGLGPYILRNYKNRDQLDYSIARTAKKVFLYGCFLCLLFVVIFHFIYDVQKNTLFFIYLCITFQAAISISSSLNRAKGDSLSYFNLVGLQKVIQVGLLFSIFIFFAESDENGVLLALAASCLLSLAISKFNLFPENKNGVNKSDVNNVIRYCFPIMISNSIFLMIPLYERFLLIKYFPTSEVSQYIFNFDLIAKISAVSLIILKIIVFPSVLDKDRLKEESKYILVKKSSYSYIISFSILIAILSLFFYDPFIALFGVEPFAFKHIFFIGITYFCLISLNYVVYIGLMIRGKTSVMLYGNLLMLLGHFMGIGVAIQFKSIIFAAYSLVLSQLINFIYCSIMNWRAGKSEYLQSNSNKVSKTEFDV